MKFPRKSLTLNPMWTEIEQCISQAMGKPFRITDKCSLGGGCINEAYRITGNGHSWFIKLNRASGLEMFEAEEQGLRELAAADAIRVPVPLVSGIAGTQAFLVMEYIDMGGGANPAAMGAQLAELHRRQAPQFGWDRDNTIGSTTQINQYCDDWVEFWKTRRLRFQLEMAASRGIGSAAVKNGERLSDSLDTFFRGYTPVPSLLHGDLWGGNAAADGQGNPVIFDPATYYGDREADIAMTELFGGFGRNFYSAYEASWPLDPGYVTRKTLYNLYHILNHYNMFGGGYGSQAERMIRQLLAEV